RSAPCLPAAPRARARSCRGPVPRVLRFPSAGARSRLASSWDYTRVRRGATMTTDPIEHVIVLMLENRSFDHVLGGCPKVQQKTAHAPDGRNQYAGKGYSQQPGAARVVTDDPHHDLPDVKVQLSRQGSVKVNGGFVLDYGRNYPQLATPGEVMKYHQDGALPAIQALAGAFTVCDRLNEQGKEWKVYFGDTPLSLLLVHQWEPQNVLPHHPMTEFYRDAAGDPKDFP